jgi:hypothetical protein
MLKITGLVVIAAVAGFGFFIWSWQRPVFHFDPHTVPHDLVTASFIDFDRIYAVSKFRSGAGHDYSHTWDGETCRSMKHYFNILGGFTDAAGKIIRSPATPTEPIIKIYAPFDGTITSADPEHIGTQAHIRSKRYPEYFVRIFHIDLLPGFRIGTEVTSGEWIGSIGPQDGTDFSVEANIFPFNVALISYFEVMSDDVFNPFAHLGFKREDFIFSKAYRDAHPFTCGNSPTKNPLIPDPEAFNHTANRDWKEDFIFIRPSPYLDRFNEPGRPIHIGPPTP